MNALPTERLLIMIDLLVQQMHNERSVTRYQELQREHERLVAEVEARKREAA
jgi:hypothetical protein